MLTAEQKRIAIALAGEGKTLAKIREAIKIDQNSFWEARLNDPEFNEKFVGARQEGLEELADGLLTITEEEQDVYKARLRSENLRWILSKRKPMVYGDRIDVNVVQTVDIGAALKEARSRALPIPPSYPAQRDAMQVIEITATSGPNTPDHKSDAAEIKDAIEIASDDIFS